jgi:hypothetical protein
MKFIHNQIWKLDSGGFAWFLKPCHPFGAYAETKLAGNLDGIHEMRFKKESIKNKLFKA